MSSGVDQGAFEEASSRGGDLFTAALKNAHRPAHLSRPGVPHTRISRSISVAARLAGHLHNGVATPAACHAASGHTEGDAMQRLCAWIALTAASVACGGPAAPASAPVAAAAPLAAHTPQPHANLAQLMRGVPFTFANIIFDSQSSDPGAPRDPAAVGGGATSTFKNVYGGWQEVENSALALAEVGNLLLVPGRACENGKPVPVQDELFQKAAAGLVDAGMAAYKAAQSKNLDAMVEVSDTVAMSCSTCHEPYRDFDDQSQRCTPVDTK
jgi:hypothetical protein